jgi:hypothetical protein
MSSNFEELDFRPTAIGTLSLRRQRQLSTGIDIFEIKLGDEFLMSSLFTAAKSNWRGSGSPVSSEPASMSSSAGSGWTTPRRPCSHMMRWDR